MTEILLCNQAFNSDKLKNQCGIDTSNISGLECGTKPEILLPYRPYLLQTSPSAQQQSILRQLNTGADKRSLTDLSLTFGGDNTLALANVSETLNQQQVGVIGASTSVYAGRIHGFGLAVKKYQDALLEYRKLIKAEPAKRALAKRKAFKAFEEMQIRFRHELSSANPALTSRRGTPLNNPTRATNIARSSRNIAKLNITSQTQATNLVKFGKYAKVLGNGLAVIDFGSRIGNIQNTYQANGEWERELFIESSSFVASAVTGTAIVNTGLAILMVATPVGWVGLIIGGAIIAGTAAGASIWANNKTKNMSGDMYDDIIMSVNSLW